MATVTGFTAERMLNIENSTVVDGEVQGDNLILLTRDGTPIDAGSVRGAKGDTGAIGEPVHTGIISMYGGNTAPAGYLICDGRLVSRVTYAALFAEIGTIWGAGDGLNNFGLPNLQQRFPIGKGTELHADVLGETGGSKDAAVVSHTHDIGHTHNTANHQHGFDHGHTAATGYESADHYHNGMDHMHQASNVNYAGIGYPYRNPNPGDPNGYDIANPGSGVELVWHGIPPSSWSGNLNTSGQIGSSTGNRNTHSHSVSIPSLTGTATSPSGAQALTHAGNTGPATSSVPPTNANLPPYVVVNFIIKT